MIPLNSQIHCKLRILNKILKKLLNFEPYTITCLHEAISSKTSHLYSRRTHTMDEDI